MAAPHVAGAAALLLQAEPSLTPAQVKSRLLNSAVSLSNGENLRQGVGLLNVDAAFEKHINVMPAIGYFGNIQTPTSFTNNELKFTISNESSEDKLLNTSISGDFPKGVEFVVVGSNELNISKGSQSDVVIALNIDSESFEPIEVATFGIDAKLHLDDGNSITTIPLTVSRMLDLSISSPKENIDIHYFINRANAELSIFGETSETYYVPVGNYTGVLINEAQNKIVFEENLSLASDQNMVVDFGLAKNEINITNLIGPSGTPYVRSEFESKTLLDFLFKNSNFHLTLGTKFFVHGSMDFNLFDESIFISDLSENTEIRLASIASLPSINDDQEVNFLGFFKEFKGISKNQEITIDVRDMFEQLIDVEDDSFLQGGGVATEFSTMFFKSPGYKSNIGLNGFTGGGENVWQQDASESYIYHSEPYKIRIYGSPQILNMDHYFGYFNLNVMHKSRERTKILSDFYFSDDSYINILETPSDYLEVFGRVSHKFPVGEIQFRKHDLLTQSVSIKVERISEENYSLSVRGYSHDSLHNKIYDSEIVGIDYALYCDEHRLNPGFESAWFEGGYYGGCDLNNHITNNITLRDASYPSLTELSIPGINSTNHSFSAYTVHNIHATQMGNVVTSRLSDETAQVHVSLNHAEDLDSIKIEIKANGAWQELSEITKSSFIINKDLYSAKIPIPEKGAVANLRVSASDKQGKKTTSLLTGSLLIGKDQSTVFTDDFDNDGIPDYRDEDDDNDGYLDIDDEVVLDANEWLDFDNDGVGNNADTDDDNDGFDDSQDCAPFDAALNENCFDVVLQDFNGDGFGDLLYRNDVNHTWMLNQLTIDSGSSQSLFSGFSKVATWEFNGTGDFNGDSHLDVLIRNSTSGQWYMYALTGTEILERGYVPLESAEYVEVQSIADFNNDGKADVVLRNNVTGEWKINLLSGRTVMDVLSPPMSQNMSWEIISARDFDGNGSADILIRNEISNAWYLYLYQNTNIVQRGYHNSIGVESNESVLATGDFNRDDISDLLVQDKTNGALSLIIFNGFEEATRLTTGLGGSDNDILEFHAVNDVNGDGISDILLRDNVNGQIKAHLFNELGQIDQVSWLDSYIDNDWQVQTLN